MENVVVTISRGSEKAGGYCVRVSWTEKVQEYSVENVSIYSGFVGDYHRVKEEMLKVIPEQFYEALLDEIGDFVSDKSWEYFSERYSHNDIIQRWSPILQDQYYAWAERERRKYNNTGEF